MICLCLAGVTHTTTKCKGEAINAQFLTKGASRMQGLNIAPALIAIAPVKTVVNPVGPLAITDTLISASVPALP